MKKNISKVICLGAALSCLIGCSSDAAEQTGGAGQVSPVFKNNTITYQLLETPQLDYEVPEITPGICVPSGGYDAVEEKLVHVFGKVLPKEFSVLEKESGEVVYTADFSKVEYHKDTGSYSAVADITEITDIGEYVFFCDYLGYSYPFSISERLQETALIDMIDAFEKQLTAEGDLQSRVDGVLTLLLSYELYEEAYETPQEETPKVLQIVQDYVENLVQELEKEESALEYDPYMLAALLTKYGYTYQTYDWNAGNDAIKLAKKLYKEAEKEITLLSEYKILAAAELYRAAGTYSYRKFVQDYFEAQLAEKKALTSSTDVLASLTYFTTSYKVQRALCTSLMEELLDKAEDIAAYIDLDNQLLSSSSREEKLDEIMWNMVYVSVVEYVITNYEYGDLLENQYFYLQGRNPESYDYVNEMIMENPCLQAAYIMMTCEHLAHDHLK